MAKNNLLSYTFIALTIVSLGSFVFLQSIDQAAFADVNNLHKLEANINESISLIEIDFVKSIINTILNIVKV